MAHEAGQFGCRTLYTLALLHNPAVARGWSWSETVQDRAAITRSSWRSRAADRMRRRKAARIHCFWPTVLARGSLSTPRLKFFYPKPGSGRLEYTFTQECDTMMGSGGDRKMVATTTHDSQRIASDPEAKILRTAADLMTYFKENFASLSENADLVDRLERSICTDELNGLSVITCLYYGDIYEQVSAQQFEKFLNALGYSWDLFSAIRDMRCVSSGGDYPRRYCVFCRGCICGLSCQP